MMFFFHKDPKRDSVYHWHRKCRLVPAGVGSNPDWIMSNLAPESRSECQFCSRPNGTPEREPPSKDPKETAPIIPGPRRQERQIR